MPITNHFGPQTKQGVNLGLVGHRFVIHEQKTCRVHKIRTSTKHKMIIINTPVLSFCETINCLILYSLTLNVTQCL